MYSSAHSTSPLEEGGELYHYWEEEEMNAEIEWEKAVAMMVVAAAEIIRAEISLFPELFLTEE